MNDVNLVAARAFELTASAYELSIMLVLASVALALIRVVRGPTIVDRVIAVDLITMLGVSLISFHAIRVDEPLLVDVVLSLAVVAFLAMMAFARWLDVHRERTAHGEPRP
jgi:multicomponent Na+:H+ antiporter subunit F